MPNPTITASSYAGEFAGKYIAASLLTAKTLDDAAITILPNIKYKAAMKVGAFSNLVRSADCDFDSTTSGLTLTEKVLTPTELQVNLQICKKELHADWEAAQMGFSAFDNLPPLFSDFVIARVAAEVASATETSIWGGSAGEGNFDGFVTLATADSTVVDVTAGTVTSEPDQSFQTETHKLSPATNPISFTLSESSQTVNIVVPATPVQPQSYVITSSYCGSPSAAKQSSSVGAHDKS